MQGRIGVGNLMVIFVANPQAVQNFDGLFGAGRINQNGLETPFQCAVFFDVLAVLVQGGCANALQLSARQCGLENVGCIQ